MIANHVAEDLDLVVRREQNAMPVPAGTFRCCPGAHFSWFSCISLSKTRVPEPLHRGRQVEHRDSAGVVGGHVVVDVGADRVLDLDAGHVALARLLRTTIWSDWPT